MPDASSELSGTALVISPPPAFDPALDAALDEALMETFPASDPVAISVPARPRRIELSQAAAPTS